MQVQGEYNLKIYYVKKGLLRSYIIDEKGKTHVYMFAPEYWMVADKLAISRNKPAQLFIDALEDSEVEVLSAASLNKSKEYSREFYKTEFYRILNRASVLQERILMLMSASALKRYHHFEITYPQIIDRVPQKMIASYLGITPQALSKIRSAWAKQK